ncbi:MAG: SEC-C motif-containing protein [Pseudohongiellaceae bacterium]
MPSCFIYTTCDYFPFLHTIRRMKSNDPCICGSNKPFGKCCEPYLNYTANPKTVKQLVRSRYAAYALGENKHREYLVRTWHPATAKNIRMADLIAEGHVWKGLSIIDSRQKGDLGRVEFEAVYSVDDGPDQVHHETSAFHRDKGLWLYLEGEVKEQPV